MNGFLRQLASRSVGAAPRLRSAPSPRAVEVAGAVPRAAWREDARDAAAATGGTDAFVRTASGDEGSDGVRPVHTPSQSPWFAGLGHAERNADNAGATGRDAADAAGVQAVHPGVAAPIAAADRATHRAARHELNGQAMHPAARGTRAPGFAKADDDASNDRHTRPAAASPITRPLPAAAPGAHDGTAVADPAAPPVPAFAADAPSRPAPDARGDATPAAFAPRLPAQPPPPPEVHITIDRLEVAPPPPRAAPAAPRSSALSLRAYLTARRTGLP